ncbi:oxidoreductase [Lactobacillus sp. S2-2]|uniref:FAD/NAD(P)-binding protein n=1 Tax=Lactobacillus sp. S2-2 TaxID=2692917 RepID=UPI001F1FFDC9|nr:FAD/NAD(P)-binding protein [Lactobacillus sp. S2-2]MCF6514713.1 oxidoreductase [Lactobacillus sp. S2-2]
MKIAIIGAGPRGLIMADQILKKSNNDVEINLFDSYQIGGKVWRTDQPKEYIANTPAQQLTLFNDINQSTNPGPNLYEWSKLDEAINFVKENQYSNQNLIIDSMNNLSENGYTKRFLFGIYAQWFYKQFLFPTNRINFINQEVNNIQEENNKYILSTENNEFIANKIILSTGQTSNDLNSEEQALVNYSEDNQLDYYLPNHPGNVDLSDINEDNIVAIRGLGLSFFDYLTELTQGRGGSFKKEEDGNLTYIPSGNEPKIFAGSIRGVPYYAKAINEKKMDELVTPQFLTKENINQQLDSNKKLPYQNFINLISNELSFIYYSLLIDEKYPDMDSNQFKQQFIQADDKHKLIDSYQFNDDDLLVWEKLLNPVAGLKITNISDYQSTLINWIDRIANDAKKGSKHGPLTSALEALRDFRNIIRDLVLDDTFETEEYISKFLKMFNSLEAFLAVGPPEIRFKELSALIKAGIVTIFGPQLQVVGANRKFMIRSRFYPNDMISADTLIEARVPKFNLIHSNSSLLQNMVRNNLITNHKFKLNDEIIDDNAIDINKKDYSSTKNNDIYVWGLPVEGIDWMTTSIPRPQVNDHNFIVVNKITENILK